MTTLPQLLAAMRALASAATPGPWNRHCKDCGVIEALEVPDGEGGPLAFHVCETYAALSSDHRGHNAAFIAMANPQMVAALVRVAEAADGLDRAARDYAKESTKALKDYDPGMADALSGVYRAKLAELREALAGLEGVGK